MKGKLKNLPSCKDNYASTNTKTVKLKLHLKKGRSNANNENMEKMKSEALSNLIEIVMKAKTFSTLNEL